MKQFNLKEYLANPSRKVVTRDGKSARIICTDRKSDFNVVALVKFSEFENERVYCYSDNGKYLSGRDGNNLDLFFAPEKHEGWVNMYRDRKGKYIIADSEIYPTKEVASNYMLVGLDYIVPIKVEWEE